MSALDSSVNPTPHRLPMALRIGMALMLIGALLVVMFAGSDRPAGLPESGPVTAQRNLLFTDLGHGQVLVTDPDTQAEIETLPAGEDNFIRGVMRGLARERRALGIDDIIPVHLSAHADGALRLSDPATGRELELTAFGPDNVKAFARLLGPAGNS